MVRWIWNSVWTSFLNREIWKWWCEKLKMFTFTRTDRQTTMFSKCFNRPRISYQQGFWGAKSENWGLRTYKLNFWSDFSLWTIENNRKYGKIWNWTEENYCYMDGVTLNLLRSRSHVRSHSESLRSHSVSITESLQ